MAVGPYLTDKEIESIIARKKLILDEVAWMIKHNGGDKVLYQMGVAHGESVGTAKLQTWTRI